MKVVSGHQPVYLPWLGLIHKAKMADIFIYMDDVQYLSGDWNNRNKIKSPQGKPLWLTVPVDLKNSSSNKLNEILIVDQENLQEKKRWPTVHLQSLKMAYGKSRFFKDYKQFFEWLYLENKWERLSDLNLAVLKQLFSWFDITAEIVMGSEQDFVESKSDLVLEHGKRFNADIVFTGCHGQDYIDVDSFKNENMKVVFQDYNHPEYEQRFGEFLSHMAFVDLLFNHGPDAKEICFSNNISKENL
ncbi:MAG: WbqC family protein [Bacteriovoracaceae bacterium]|jgi:hypothetical protein|nr:WbqC family protein [Bacteriovoracaceae bacterium]